MYLVQENKYQIKIELEQFLSHTLANECQDRLLANLNFLDNLTCHTVGKFIEIIFNPPSEITDEYLFKIIEETLKAATLTFTKAVLRQYVGNAVRTLAASVTGGTLGSKGGAVGVLLGAIGGAIIEKALFDWKDICECTCDEYGNLSMIDLRGENNDYV